jgi:hypothetical protein
MVKALKCNDEQKQNDGQTCRMVEFTPDLYQRARACLLDDLNEDSL